MVHLLLILHAALSAGTYLAAKRALFELSAFELALVRFVLAAACYAALLLRAPPRISRRELGGMAVLGFVAVPLNQGLFLLGLSLSTPGHAALLYALTPVFVFLVARVRLGERAGPAEILGIAVAFAGVVLVLLGRGHLGEPEARRGLLGDLLILLAVVAWAVYVVGGKPYAQRHGAVVTSGVTLVVGTLLYVPLGLAASDFRHFQALSATGWAAVAYLVVVTSVVAYVIYYWALARADATRVAIWSNLQPVITAVLAWAIYGERLTGSFLAGGALVLAGVILTERG